MWGPNVDWFQSLALGIRIAIIERLQKQKLTWIAIPSLSSLYS
jgi:hypothetical protein